MTHNPNETTRRLVVALASVGTQQDRIARMIGVAPGTLRAAYRAELDDGLARAVAGAATNMFRLALKQSSTGFMAARHVLRCFGGPAWKDTANITVNPGADAMAYLEGSDNAREIIAGKLAQLAARNGEIGGRAVGSRGCGAVGTGKPGAE
jgi:hypothetical protein